MKESYHHGDLSSALSETGQNMLEKDGVENLSLRKIAAEIGVSHTAPYRHFKDKNELLAKIAENGYRELAESILSAMNGAGNNSLTRLISMAVAYVSQQVRYPETSKLMFSGILHIASYPALHEAAESAYNILVDLINEGQKRGEIAQGDIQTYAAAVWSAMHGISLLIQAENHVSEEYSRQVINCTVPAVMDVMISGLGAR